MGAKVQYFNSVVTTTLNILFLAILAIVIYIAVYVTRTLRRIEKVVDKIEDYIVHIDDMSSKVHAPNWLKNVF